MPCLHCQLATGRIKTHTWSVDGKRRYSIVDDPQTGTPLVVVSDHRARPNKRMESEIRNICRVAFGKGKLSVKRRTGHLAYVWVRESR